MYQTEELLAFDHALKNESNKVFCGPSLDVFVRTTQRCVGRRRQGFHYQMHFHASALKVDLGGSLPRACRERKIIETRLGACVLGGVVSEKP